MIAFPTLLELGILAVHDESCRSIFLLGRFSFSANVLGASEMAVKRYPAACLAQLEADMYVVPPCSRLEQVGMTATADSLRGPAPGQDGTFCTIVATLQKEIQQQNGSFALF